MKRGKRALPAFLILISQLFLCGVNQGQVDYFSPEKVYEFAEYLYQDGDYLRAAGEFQRFLLLAGTTAGSDSTLFRIGMCYRLGQRPRRAIDYFQRIGEEDPQSNLKDHASYQIAYSYFQMGQHHQSIQQINKSCPQLAGCGGKLGNLLVVNYLHLKRWKEAHDISSSMMKSDGSSSDSLATALNRLTLEGTRLPYKSQALAGMMSSLVPGSGKMYAHRFKDGLYSMIVIGLTGWQAYDGFSKDGRRSARGWIYGTLSGVFYLGNIYGSVVAVKIYNQRMEDDFLNRINVNATWE